MDNFAFLSEFIAAWNAHDKARLLDLYHPEYDGLDISEGKRAEGLGDVARMVDYILTAFPDLHMELLEWGADDNRLFFFWKATGHQRGRLLNIPPTGKPVSFTGSSFMDLQEGKVVRSRRLWDVATALRQIGLLPEPTSTVYV